MVIGKKNLIKEGYVSFDGMDVPEILRSGNDKLIEAWRHEQAVKRTMERRPDLLDE